MRIASTSADKEIPPGKREPLSFEGFAPLKKAKVYTDLGTAPLPPNFGGF